MLRSLRVSFFVHKNVKIKQGKLYSGSQARTRWSLHGGDDFTNFWFHPEVSPTTNDVYWGTSSIQASINFLADLVFITCFKATPVYIQIMFHSSSSITFLHLFIDLFNISCHELAVWTAWQTKPMSFFNGIICRLGSFPGLHNLATASVARKKLTQIVLFKSISVTLQRNALPTGARTSSLVRLVW